MHSCQDSSHRGHVPFAEPPNLINIVNAIFDARVAGRKESGKMPLGVIWHTELFLAVGTRSLSEPQNPGLWFSLLR